MNQMGVGEIPWEFVENLARGRVVVRELCTALRKMANEEETQVKEKSC